MACTTKGCGIAMIHYHGLPITPNTAALEAIKSGHAFVSYAHPEQLPIAMEVCQSFALDNGAFSAWRKGEPIQDWTPFMEWSGEIAKTPNCDFIVVPDVIDGDLHDQFKLIDQFIKHFGGNNAYKYGAPVFHLHEPLHHAKQLSKSWQRICIGSSGEYAQIGTQKWWARMAEIMTAICDEQGRPNCKLHGLRMLNPEVFTKFPFASADSTNIGRNIGIDKSWKGNYMPPSKEVRAAVMRSRIESYNSAREWNFSIPEQQNMCLF